MDNNIYVKLFNNLQAKIGCWKTPARTVDEFGIVFDKMDYEVITHNCWTGYVHAYPQPCTALFSDAKPAENNAKQVVGREFTGNFTQRLLCQAQFFGKEFKSL